MNNNVQGLAVTGNSQKLDLQIEIENWEDQINFMAKETSFYLQLVVLPVLIMEDPSFILQGLHEIKNTNKRLENTLLQYKNQLNGLNECDDLQCETYYLEQHEEVRAKIEKHQQRFRALKFQIFQKSSENKKPPFL